MTARRTKLIKESGPYEVRSCANGELHVYPQWSNYPRWSNFEPFKGSGPGVLSRIRLAREIEEFLNVGTKEES